MRLRYSASDGSGHAIASGTMLIHIARDGTMSGTWNFTPAGSVADDPMRSQRFGPQFGSGSVVGSAHGESYTLDLNRVVDNSVLLSGTLRAGSLRGTWRYFSDAGLTARGTFEAHAAK